MNDFYEEYNHFRRLHPLTLIYGLFRNLPFLGLTVYFGIFRNQTEDIITILMFILIGMITIPGQILRWYYFSFMISNTEIIIKSGIFSRKQRNIPLERIQNVNVRQDLLQRILGIAKVTIETAGDVTAEGNLEYVKLKDADDINKIIRTYQKNKTITNNEVLNHQEQIKSETYNPSSEGNVLLKMSNRDVLVYGMIRLRPLFLIYGAWFMSFITQFKQLNDWFYGYLDETMNSFVDLPLYYLIPLSLAFIVCSVIISWIIDIIWTFAQYYGFRLIKDGNKLFASYGLLSKYSITIPLKKLQQISINTNPVKKKFDFYSMILYTAGYDISMKTAPSAVPLAKREILNKIAGQIYPVNIPDEFSRISEKSIRRTFLRYLITMTPFLAGAFYFFEFYGAFGLLIIPLLYYVSILQWRYRGYLVQDDIVFIKQGIWNQKVNIIPTEKIQTLHISESFFQRRLGLATVYIDTAASGNFYDAYIPDVDTDISLTIFENINSAFKKSNKVRTI